MMRQTIIQIVGNGDAGGGTTAVLTLAKMLHAHGQSVVIASQQNSYLLNTAAQAGITTLEFDFSSRRSAIANCFAIARLLKQDDVAVVHAHGGRAGLPVALAYRLTSAGRRIRFVYTVHGFHFLAKKKLAFHLARFAEKFCIATASRTNFVSYGDEKIAQAQKLLTAKTETAVIPNAVLVDDIPKAQQRDLDIVFIGRLTSQKNPLLVPEIIAAMKPLRPSVQVIGGGELEDAFKKKVIDLGLETQFRFWGTQKRDAALNIAGRCKVLLLPSLWEGHPITVIEAMHLGLPVVASRISGTEEIVQDGVTGYLTSMDDVKGYASNLCKILQDPFLAKKLGETAISLAERHFSANQMLQKNLVAYQIKIEDNKLVAAISEKP